MSRDKNWLLPIISIFLLSVGTTVLANGPISCDDLSEFGDGNVITIDFEDIATGPGSANAVNLAGNEFPGLTLSAATAPGLWVGVPVAPPPVDNCNLFYGNDFYPVSGDAVFSPDNCTVAGSPVGAVMVNFDNPVEAVGLSFLDAEGAVSSLTAYDAMHEGGSVLDSATATGLPDDSQAYRQVSSSPTFIQSVMIQLGGGDDGVGMDDLCYVYPDSDSDGIPDHEDLCADTVADVPTSNKGLGVNRWIWDGDEWVTNARGVDKSFTIEETQGCSCEQILDELVLKTDKSFDGHYKFGCSQSVVEDWIAGLYYMETVEVPAADTDGVDSFMTLKAAEHYQLMAYGVADALDADAQHIWFDAKYSVTTQAPYFEDPDVPGDWTDSVTHYESEGTELLDLHVNSVNVDWGAFDSSHVYWHDMPGTDNPVNLWIYDVYYPNNAGSLFVDIFVELW